MKLPTGKGLTFLFSFFHTNACLRDLYLLFRRYGTILSVHIMVNKATGLSKGYGFVSFAYPNDAKTGMEAMDGFRVGSLHSLIYSFLINLLFVFQLGKKRLKVQLKRLQDDTGNGDDFIFGDEQDDEEEDIEFIQGGNGKNSVSPTSRGSVQRNQEQTRVFPSSAKLNEATKQLSEMTVINPNKIQHYFNKNLQISSNHFQQ
jgi:RNA recognition motif-containing protein